MAAGTVPDRFNAGVAGRTFALTVMLGHPPETLSVSGKIGPPSKTIGGYKMKSKRTVFAATVSIAGLATSLALAGCGPQPGAPAPASTSAAAPVAPVTGAVPASKVPASSEKHVSPGLKTFTFPDGHISFAYPEAWTVRTVQPPAGLPGVEAIVADGAGKDLLILANGVTTGCAGGPVSRRVFDQVPVPGMTAPDSTEPNFGFVAESYGNGAAYFMGLADLRSLNQGDGVASWCNLVTTANGGLITRVLFDDPAFPDAGAARAWMNTDQYAQLKALLVSLSYT